MNNPTRWHKSSYSGNDHCVELSRPQGLIRDSKDPNGPALAVDVAAFMQAIKDGRFEH
ncbi:DUF397 domain-containing protein [Saccharopolyspora phatthalungensis]|uniref:DUF397 domain-containing protein n=1 Tax=Saccharopolyspora phatthalungensis TaxID=664693 RepID=A0A840QEN8_9PSEU|nr:DUF397 domain-containing protein [Saccharopolyspora phatthalungensis]MBB5158471.1 hypothetical protein [Saccharopolyspora phatthalungensis]